MSFDMPKTGAWETRAGWVVRNLSNDLGLTLPQAAGFVGNLGFESAEFTAFHEKGQPDGQGGYGWAQWTASRRVSFFAWCTAQGLAAESDEANYGYLVTELRGSYASTVTVLRQCVTVDQATWSVGQTYERPGGTTPKNLPGYDKRLEYARRAYSGAQRASGPTPTLAAAIAPAPAACDTSEIDADLVADLVRALQRVVDASPDGRMGPNTYSLVMGAQRKRA